MQTSPLLCSGQPLIFKGHPWHTFPSFTSFICFKSFHPFYSAFHLNFPLLCCLYTFLPGTSRYLTLSLASSVALGRARGYGGLNAPQVHPRSVRWKIHQSLGATQLGKILRPSTDLICQVPVGGADKLCTTICQMELLPQKHKHKPRSV